jgi:muconolactone delta-isomerase
MRFMVDITFIPQHQSEIAALVPKEQAHIKTLMEQGIVQAIYISADRSHVWVVMQGESQEHVQQELQSFPLYPYMKAEFAALV